MQVYFWQKVLTVMMCLIIRFLAVSGLPLSVTVPCLTACRTIRWIRRSSTCTQADDIKGKCRLCLTGMEIGMFHAEKR